ncbi:flagellar biosynthesis anti-sigma factor FlgM [Gemmatimonas sp.]|uniref:flagellar biosynthesis anti-sigma factor FlgM n=1 Tax=Gemmatimonas sp. TaxID=1962908 RepID=UPI0022BBE5F2|nr:flagellar biosynthesis anti-sigma factor FlgM [Gemmatimonas sp.]MCZ8203891.1 flagellar biosynthesis anti-sigma factor FlgM [Gemmatimonas sp.]
MIKINGYIDSLRVAPVGTPAGPRPAQEVSQVPDAKPVKADSVRISDTARRLNAEQNDPFDPERVAELRQRVLSGAYNTLDVVDQVARRMLTRGDL